jgi:hypothetical protein
MKLPFQILSPLLVLFASSTFCDFFENSREFSANEINEIREFVADIAGVDAWQISGSVRLSNGREIARAIIAHSPNDYVGGLCVARTLLVKSASLEAEEKRWQVSPYSNGSRSLWFSTCSNATQGEEIRIGASVDPQSLHLFRDSAYQILSDGFELWGHIKPMNGEVADYRLMAVWISDLDPKGPF